MQAQVHHPAHTDIKIETEQEKSSNLAQAVMSIGLDTQEVVEKILYKQGSILMASLLAHAFHISYMVHGSAPAAKAKH